ncbi:hypothetical protein [Actinomadura rifamycini]|uniref:hypothetical protein n=1 Tax=Actinomadura rifamycini TaxID=31962 RepID=UPI0003FA2A51|nr:hypothetical protein [Actinomadura rifamycini]
MPAPASMDGGTLDERVAGMSGKGEVARSDEASLAVFGADPLSSSSRTPSAGAARTQGRTLAAFWE